jgi:hypothetical protein
MRKYLLALLFVITFSCTQDSIEDIQMIPNESLTINLDEGIKLENYIVTDEVLMNLKVSKSGRYDVKIKDISGNIVSKEVIDLKLGSNVHKLYVKVLPKSSYTVELIDGSNKLIGTEIFSMQN